MNYPIWSKTIVVAGVACVLSSAACDRGERAQAANEAQGHIGAPIRLTGCLQKDPGITSTYLLTVVNEPTKSVGTSGSTSSVVEDQRVREAKHAYRVDGDKDQLERLVGKQVQLQGTVAENSDLSKKAENPDARKDIDSGDLAKVEVVTIAQVADVCGDTTPRP